ncbi:MAG: hypothetical protein ACK4L4_06050 [Gemmobacter sp.]
MNDSDFEKKVKHYLKNKPLTPIEKMGDQELQGRLDSIEALDAEIGKRLRSIKGNYRNAGIDPLMTLRGVAEDKIKIIEKELSKRKTKA